MFSTNKEDNFRKPEYRKLIENADVPKTESENIDVYNNQKFSEQPDLKSFRTPLGIEHKGIDNFTDDYYKCKVTTESLLNGFVDKDWYTNVNSLKNEDEASFFEKSDALQNLICTIPEISESYCVEEEKKDFEDQKTDIVYENQCTLDSICGLSDIKENLLSIFIYPTIFPDFFPEKIRWNRILFFGPPGTGKSMLAKAIASEINATLHRISSADLLSHWQGESEKQIRRLFEDARSSSEPTILFFDEIDGLCRKRSNTEDDSVRRIKTELLVQFEDFIPEIRSNQTYIIGATNCPWEIDSAFMRRFHKKIFIPLPDKEARLNILKKSFENIKTDLSDSEWNEIGKKTEGYSGSDLLDVVMSSCCERLADMKKCKYWEAKGDIWVPASSHSLFLTRMNFEDVPKDKIGCRNIIFSDLEAGIGSTPPSVGPEEMVKYLEFLTINK